MGALRLFSPVLAFLMVFCWRCCSRLQPVHLCCDAPAGRLVQELLAGGVCDAHQGPSSDQGTADQLLGCWLQACHAVPLVGLYLWLVWLWQDGLLLFVLCCGSWQGHVAEAPGCQQALQAGACSCLQLCTVGVEQQECRLLYGGCLHADACRLQHAVSFSFFLSSPASDFVLWCAVCGPLVRCGEVQLQLLFMMLVPAVVMQTPGMAGTPTPA